MTNVEKSLVRTFALFPKHVIFTPRYERSLQGIGVGRFRILGVGGQGLKYWRGQGGPNSQIA